MQRRMHFLQRDLVREEKRWNPISSVLQKLEEIANTTEGVDKSFAIQAGREIRIIAKPDEVGDDAIGLLAT